MKELVKFAGHPDTPVLKGFSDGYHGILFADYGPLWLSQRKFAISTLRRYMKKLRYMIKFSYLAYY